MDKYILSFFQATEILQALDENRSEIEVSLDLNLTESKMILKKNGVIFPNKQKLDYQKIQKIFKDKNKCFLVVNSNIEPIVIFSDTTKWVRTLFPTSSAPTTLVSGTLMHRIKNITPDEDTNRKIGVLAPLKDGIILDTATGLGYSAIAAAKEAESVITIEIDPTAIELAKFNPWSKDLFENPKITQIIGDTTIEIGKFKSEKFTHIFHDPPTFNLGGELYSQNFYLSLFRVLKKGGKLFHYIGDPKSDYGKKMTKGIMNRIKVAGFGQIKIVDKAFGIVVYK